MEALMIRYLFRAYFTDLNKYCLIHIHPICNPDMELSYIFSDNCERTGCYILRHVCNTQSGLYALIAIVMSGWWQFEASIGAF